MFCTRFCRSRVLLPTLTVKNLPRSHWRRGPLQVHDNPMGNATQDGEKFSLKGTSKANKLYLVACLFLWLWLNADSTGRVCKVNRAKRSLSSRWSVRHFVCLSLSRLSATPMRLWKTLNNASYTRFFRFPQLSLSTIPA